MSPYDCVVVEIYKERDVLGPELFGATCVRATDALQQQRTPSLFDQAGQGDSRHSRKSVRSVGSRQLSRILPAGGPPEVQLSVE